MTIRKIHIKNLIKIIHKNSSINKMNSNNSNIIIIKIRINFLSLIYKMSRVIIRAKCLNFNKTVNNLVLLIVLNKVEKNGNDRLQNKK